MGRLILGLRRLNVAKQEDLYRMIHTEVKKEATFLARGHIRNGSFANNVGNI